MELKAGYKQSEVGVIPEDWDVKKVKDFTDGTAGGTPSTSIGAYWGGDIPWMSSGELHLKNVYDVEERITEEGLKNSSTKLIPVNCILIGLAGQGKTRGTVAVNRIPLCTNQSIAAIFPNENFVTEYLFYNLENRYDELRSLSTGDGGRGGLNLTILRNFKLSFPTKEEQTAIAGALSDADALIAALERLIAKKRQIKQGAMQTLLNPYDENGHLKTGWEVKILGEVGTFSKGSGVKKDESNSGRLPCIRYGEIYTKHKDVIKQFYSFISKEVASCAKRLKKGDLLFAGSGETREEIGKCVAFINDFEAYAGGDIVILTTKSDNATFLGYYLNTSPVNRQKASKGQGDAVVHIGATALSKIEIIIPSNPDEQTHIATILSDMDAEIDALETKLAKARKVKQGMMQNLLSGRIRLV